MPSVCRLIVHRRRRNVHLTHPCAIAGSSSKVRRHRPNSLRTFRTVFNGLLIESLKRRPKRKNPQADQKSKPRGDRSIKTFFKHTPLSLSNQLALLISCHDYNDKYFGLMQFIVTCVETRIELSTLDLRDGRYCEPNVVGCFQFAVEPLPRL